MCSSRVAVSVGGGELRIFPCGHFEPSPLLMYILSHCFLFPADNPKLYGV